MNHLTAIILCGGKGERLKPFTDALPKPLVPLNGKPLLYYLLRYLFSAGVTKAILCTGYRAEAIEEFVQDNCAPEWDVQCLNSGDVSITDRLLEARRYVNGRALVCYGDTLANVDLNALQLQHESNKAWATLTVFPLHSPFGIVSFNPAHQATQFSEKPVLPYWINIGFLLCETEAFNLLQPSSDMPIFLSTLAETRKLYIYQHSDKHITVNTEKEREEAENHLVEFFTILDNQLL